MGIIPADTQIHTCSLKLDNTDLLYKITVTIYYEIFIVEDPILFRFHSYHFHPLLQSIL